jgi:hypothetical protein
VDVEIDESCTVHSDRLLSHVALRYALVTPSRSVLYGPATASRSFHSD